MDGTFMKGIKIQQLFVEDDCGRMWHMVPIINELNKELLLFSPQVYSHFPRVAASVDGNGSEEPSYVDF